MTVGADPGSPTMPDYQPPFAFTGAIKRALVDVTGTHVEDAEARCASTWRGSEIQAGRGLAPCFIAIANEKPADLLRV